MGAPASSLLPWRLRLDRHTRQTVSCRLKVITSVELRQPGIYAFIGIARTRLKVIASVEAETMVPGVNRD